MLLGSISYLFCSSPTLNVWAGDNVTKSEEGFQNRIRRTVEPVTEFRKDNMRIFRRTLAGREVRTCVSERIQKTEYELFPSICGVSPHCHCSSVSRLMFCKGSLNSPSHVVWVLQTKHILSFHLPLALTHYLAKTDPNKSEKWHNESCDKTISLDSLFACRFGNVRLQNCLRTE